MKKPKSNVFQKAKDKMSKLFGKKPKDSSVDDFDDYEEKYHEDDQSDEYEYVDEDGNPIEDDGSFEEEYVDEDGDTGEFEVNELTVSDVKNNVEDQPPGLPNDDTEMDDESEWEEDDGTGIEHTNPAFNEFKVDQKKGKLAGAFSKGKGKLGGIFGKLKKSPKKPKFSGGGMGERFSGFDFDKVFESVFSPENRRSIHHGFLALAMASSAYFTGRIVAVSLKPDSKAHVSKGSGNLKQGDPVLRDQISSIRNADLFKAEGEKIVPKGPDCKANPNDSRCKKKKVVPKDLVCDDAKRKTSLPITLVSTIILQDEVKSVASVQVRGEKGLMNFRKGEKLPKNMAQITGIQAKRLILKNSRSGECEYVAIKEKRKKRGKRGTIRIERDKAKGKKILQQSKNSGIKVTEGNKFKIKKSLRDSMLGNMSEIITQARAVQIRNPDGTLSFRMQEIVPGSIYTKLNIQNGDVINAINGKRFTNVNDIMSMFGQIKERDNYSISVKRNGSEQTFEYDFE